MTQQPRDIKAKGEQRCLEITWAADAVDRYSFRFLRAECSCAGCVDEFSGVRTLDLSTIPDDIAIKAMSLVGNYAVKITWTDNHDTGLYTWEKLRQLGPDLPSD